MDQLPKAPGSKIGLPEARERTPLMLKVAFLDVPRPKSQASFWLLLTDEIPTDAEVKAPCCMRLEKS